jgi:hypothetical protein
MKHTLLIKVMQQCIVYLNPITQEVNGTILPTWLHSAEIAVFVKIASYWVGV